MNKLQKKYYPIKNSISTKQRNNKNHFNLLGFAIIILTGITIYSNSFNCSFHLDDLNNIVNNTKIRNLLDFKALWNFAPNRVVAIFTFALNYHINQYNVWGYHCVNLIIHLINACLVWWLSMLILSSPKLKDHQIAKHKEVLALVTALLFISHPLATQSVTYIVQRMASMAAMFYFLSIAFYIKARLSGKSNIIKYLLFTCSILSATLAIFTKENAFSLPFAIIVIEFFFFHTKKFSINFKDYHVYLFIAGLTSIITLITLKFSFSIFKPIHPTQGYIFTVTPLNYLFTQISVIVKYIQLLFFPINQMLDYDFPIINNFFEIRTVLCFLLLIALILFAIFLFNKNRIISFGIFWFFLTLFIESSFIPIQDVIFEHRTYLPSFGFFLILSTGVYILLRYKLKFLTIAILSIIIVSNSYLTYTRNKVWKDNFSLWSDNIAKAPNIAQPFLGRGFAFNEIKQWDKAIVDYTKAIEINPKYALAYYNRGIAFWNLNEWNKAINDYTKAIEINPNYIDAYYNRGLVFEKLKEWDKAINDYSSALKIDSNYVKPFYSRGAAYGALQQWDKAIVDYTKAIELHPNITNLYASRGIAFCNTKEWYKALVDFSTALELNPNDPIVLSNRGIAYAQSKKWDKAIVDFSKAIVINPNFTDAYYNRGVVYENLNEWDKAIIDYTSTISLDPNYTVAITSREIAYKHLKSRKSR